jgi:hypothetical protein
MPLLLNRFVVLLALAANAPAADRPLEISLLPGERWWGGLSVDGPSMPFDGETRLSRTLYGNDAGNQAQPFLVSSRGRYVWSSQPFRYDFERGTLRISETHGEIAQERAGNSLREAFRHAASRYFPAGAPDARPADVHASAIQHLDRADV